MLPSNYAIDYEAGLSAVNEQSAVNSALALRHRLPSVWQEVYLSTISHEPNFIWFEGTQGDSGHFMARSIGGGFDVNPFSQDRLLNRGWSPQGKIYRRMEKYCREQEGTFCFLRPIYADGSNVRRWVEFGVLKSNDTLWVELFDNCVNEYEISYCFPACS